jgi:hypothetical protein
MTTSNTKACYSFLPLINAATLAGRASRSFFTRKLIKQLFLNSKQKASLKIIKAFIVNLVIAVLLVFLLPALYNTGINIGCTLRTCEPPIYELKGAL